MLLTLSDLGGFELVEKNDRTRLPKSSTISEWYLWKRVLNRLGEWDGAKLNCNIIMTFLSIIPKKDFLNISIWGQTVCSWRCSISIKWGFLSEILVFWTPLSTNSGEINSGEIKPNSGEIKPIFQSIWTSLIIIFQRQMGYLSVSLWSK